VLTRPVRDSGVIGSAGFAVGMIMGGECACMLNVQASMQSFIWILIAPVNWSKTEDLGEAVRYERDASAKNRRQSGCPRACHSFHG
jgi:hypothetical protein